MQRGNADGKIRMQEKSDERKKRKNRSGLYRPAPDRLFFCFYYLAAVPVPGVILRGRS